MPVPSYTLKLSFAWLWNLLGLDSGYSELKKKFTYAKTVWRKSILCVESKRYLSQIAILQKPIHEKVIFIS